MDLSCQAPYKSCCIFTVVEKEIGRKKRFKWGQVHEENLGLGIFALTLTFCFFLCSIIAQYLSSHCLKVVPLWVVTGWRYCLCISAVWFPSFALSVLVSAYVALDVVSLVGQHDIPLSLGLETHLALCLSSNVCAPLTTTWPSLLSLPTG